MSLNNYPWKGRGVNLFAPHHDEVDRFCSFIKKEFVRDKIDTILLIVRYNYEFKSHPEVVGDYPLTEQDVKKMLYTCRDCGIELIPDMNLLGHNTVQDYKKPDGLLRAYPEFSETPVVEEPEYAYSLCPTHPDLFPVVKDLIEEMIDVFEAKYFHMGLDEVFYIGECERCKAENKPNYILFAEWVNKLTPVIKNKGAIPMMWGDRLLDSTEFSYGPWDASDKDTAGAIDLIDKDIIITDWHYHNWHHFKSVERFAEHGFKIWLSTFNVAENAKLFLDYALEHGTADKIIGVMETTWVPCRNFMDGMEGIESPLSDVKWYNGSMKHIRRTYNWLFRPEEYDPTPIPEEE